MVDLPEVQDDLGGTSRCSVWLLQCSYWEKEAGPILEHLHKIALSTVGQVLPNSTSREVCDEIGLIQKQLNEMGCFCLSRQGLGRDLIIWE